ncbi:hypothetical protein VSX64_25050 [Aurantimonas sp. C2-6-R+9]|uniref:hypothetical protein n=1 Tax=unclassified Aurantimonas TaxID=2638230 RepID=UPI002E18A9F1|nr:MULTISPECIES: hypothetical protein [unclassified Aurantimonas]MEC5293799.1 hypothetical protein [Aurantimonas sp. C2-3-R2]MEC5383966.1 hypothetical protein [Aurantimonas sp. C2-6-R+9]MEC5414856.1 hypothetical protein [Aurantimonas sp. C2-4-R8]
MPIAMPPSQSFFPHGYLDKLIDELAKGKAMENPTGFTPVTSVFGEGRARLGH